MDRTERIIIYSRPETKKRWLKLLIDLETKNNEEALNKLMDLYELIAQYFREPNLDRLLEIIKESLGSKVRLRLVG